MKEFSLMMVSLFVSLNSSICWAENQINKQRVIITSDVTHDYMSEEQGKRLSLIPQAKVTDKEIMLENGESLHDYLKTHAPDALINRDFEKLQVK